MIIQFTTVEGSGHKGNRSTPLVYCSRQSNLRGIAFNAERKTFIKCWRIARLSSFLSVFNADRTVSSSWKVVAFARGLVSISRRKQTCRPPYGMSGCSRGSLSSQGVIILLPTQWPGMLIDVLDSMDLLSLRFTVRPIEISELFSRILVDPVQPMLYYTGMSMCN